MKKFLKKYIINNIGYKILAAVFAFLVWLVVLNITDPEYSRTISNIPVKIVNEQAVLDGTHVYTISSGDTTSVQVTGKRSIISTLSANDFLVTADFQELSLTNAVPIKVELTGDKTRYSGQVSLNPKDTSMIIKLEDMTFRTMQVEVEYTGDLPDDVVIDEANVVPKKVTLYAPESVTNAAEKVVVIVDSRFINSDKYMVLEPVIRNVSGRIIPEEGDVSLDTTQVSVEFKVSSKKDVPIVVNVSGRLADGLTFEGIELSQDYITLKGPQGTIKSLNRIVVPNDVINLNNVKEDFDFELDLTPYLPEDVSVYGESPMITVTVKIGGETQADKSGQEQEQEVQSQAEEESEKN